MTKDDARRAATRRRLHPGYLVTPADSAVLPPPDLLTGGCLCLMRHELTNWGNFDSYIQGLHTHGLEILFKSPTHLHLSSIPSLHSLRCGIADASISFIRTAVKSSSIMVTSLPTNTEDSTEGVKPPAL